MLTRPWLERYCFPGELLVRMLEAAHRPNAEHREPEVALLVLWRNLI